MKTQFKQFITEAPLERAEAFGALIGSIHNGKFTLDGTDLPANESMHVSLRNRDLTTLKGCPQNVGNFSCSTNKLTSLEFGPKSVAGDYTCKDNKLEDLKGAPILIRKAFNCSKTGIKSLKGAPNFIGGSFFCHGNNLTSLAGIPEKIGIDVADSHCSFDENKLTSLKDIHKHLLECDGKISFINNPIKSHVLGLLKIKNLQSVNFDNAQLQTIINKHLPEGDIFECQQELIDAGFEEYAQL